MFLGTIALFLMGAGFLVTGYPEHESIRGVLSHLENEPFDRSCGAEGAFDAKDSRNCMERGPYRFWRVGFGSYIGRVVDGQKPEILFSAGTRDMWYEKGIGWGDVLKP